MKHNSIPVLLLVLALASCSSSDSPCPGVTDPTGPYTVSGHLTFAQPMTLPADAEVICYWPETRVQPLFPATFDSTRIFGRGTVDRTNNTFSITMQGLPPAIQPFTQSGSCNKVDLAPPGYIMLVSRSTSPAFGQKFFNNIGALGAVDSIAVLYYASNVQLKSWFGTMPQGYSTFFERPVTHGDTTSREDVSHTNTGLELRIDTTNVPSFGLPGNWAAAVVIY
jgi:hypothetical protein